MALSHTPLRRVRVYALHVIIQIFSPFLRLDILLKRYKIPCVRRAASPPLCLCIVLFTSMTNEIIRARPHHVTWHKCRHHTRIPKCHGQASEQQLLKIYFTSTHTQMLCTLCLRQAIFYLLCSGSCSCSVCRFLDAMLYFIFFSRTFHSGDIVNPKKIIFIFCGVIFAHI